MIRSDKLLWKLPFATLLAAALSAGCTTVLAQDAEAFADEDAYGDAEYGEDAGEPNPRITDYDNPTTPADLPRTTSVLEVERYRPNYQLDQCTERPLPSAKPSAKLAEAIAKAQAYSDAQKGLGFIVLKDGAILHEGYAEGVDGSTQFASASMMKSVVALMYGVAIDEGIIRTVDDRVGDYFDYWDDEDTEDPRGDITFRQLLTMSAGLGQTNFLEILLAPDIGEAAMKMEMVAEPDTEFSYNNAITKILEMVIDIQASPEGKGSFLEFLESDLWCPLGNGKAQVWVDQLGSARGYAGLHAGLMDYARIGELIRKGGKVGDQQIVSEAWIAEMAKPSKVNPQYGLHVWLGREHTPKRAYSAASPIKVPHAEPFLAEDIVYFDGFGGQRVYVLPSQNMVVARSGEVNLAYDDSVIPNLLVAAAQ